MCWRLSKQWKFIVAVSLIAIITLFVNEETIYACSCEFDYTPAAQFEYHDAVFRGEVISKSGRHAQCDPSRAFFRESVVEFKVDTVWKGEINETTYVTTNYHEETCGYPFKIGEKYIVYAYERDGELSVSLCSRTGPAPDAQEDLEFLDEGWTPESGSSDATQPTPETLDEQCPTPMPDPTAEPPKPEANPATGGCAPLVPNARLSFDTTPLLFAVGIIWLTTRTRRRR